MKKARTNKRVLKAGDYFLFAFGAFFVTFLFIHYLFSAPSGKMVSITSRTGTVTYELSADRTVLVDGPLGQEKVVIRGGQVWMEDSPCRDKICIKMGKKKRAGEQIICLPNRIVVEVRGEELDIDAVSR